MKMEQGLQGHRPGPWFWKIFVCKSSRIAIVDQKNKLWTPLKIGRRGVAPISGSPEYKGSSEIILYRCE
jgi:hypothetical protein